MKQGRHQTREDNYKREGKIIKGHKKKNKHFNLRADAGKLSNLLLLSKASVRLIWVQTNHWFKQGWSKNLKGS